MAAPSELGIFLRARRELVRPGDVGLPTAGIRRTPGLRREELATLAGVSVDYYIRLERGKETRPSAAVLERLATALRLTEAESAHLRALAARTAGHAPDAAAAAAARCGRPHGCCWRPSGPVPRWCSIASTMCWPPIRRASP
ncbi:helix-turn-helix domain-containing protein [Nocardia terpenica]|uniref:helix-turn-helix domain-containing protein n=1 Tax=Nocardia terpenica TaxID=455432 RepID=UPI00193238FD|nr:helix-turn-helix transcriptional regulator [Nocardia terpenica]